MSTTGVSSKFTEQLAEDFGANVSYVETLLDRYLSAPSLVEESWRQYFEELLGTPGTGSENGEVTRNTGPSTGASSGQPSINGIIPSNGNRGYPSPTPKGAAAPTIALQPVPANGELLRGGAKKIVENMERSISVPTATSVRMVPVKLLDENRRIINEHLALQSRGKASYTHIIAWAILRAMDRFPQMNDGLVETVEGPARLRRENVQLGVAVDVQKKDGTRTLLVPNLKQSQALSFAEFLAAYDDVVRRARIGKLEISDFEGTTISLTNPGTIGTVGSVPRLMAGQSMIIATGAIEYPAEYQAMTPEALTQIGISKVVQISNTYDHRLVQGAESGAMLARMHELLLGAEGFYERIFSDLDIPVRPFHWSPDTNPALLPFEARERLQLRKQSGVLELINAYRVRGHLLADLDPLHAVGVRFNAELDIETYGLTIWDLDREFDAGSLAHLGRATLRIILETLRKSYCGTVGVEYRHIQGHEEKLWIQRRVESAAVPIEASIRKQILWKLISAEQFERFLHTNYLGQKRFSIEGTETLVPLMDQLINRAAEQGAEEIVFGMAHRGRLTVIANVIGHYCERIFTAFEGSLHPAFPGDEGDVKYHQGAVGEREYQGRKIALTLANNPSHLEAVDPVVEGMTRAKQDALAGLSTSAGAGEDRSVTPEGMPIEVRWQKILPVLVHGDAAFAGQGIVMETLNLSQLHGYGVGGTVHIVVNNQIGFTTSPAQGRSTVYSTDIARLTQSPIFHINADDPDAAYRTLLLALEYRTQFHKDIVLDLVGFRKLGHNESDEPSYTQPLMYSRVKEHQGIRDIYSKRLIKEKVVSEEEVKALITERIRRYDDAMKRAKDVAASRKNDSPVRPVTVEVDGSTVVHTGIPTETISSISQQISIVPPSFHLNPKMVSQLARRAKMGSGTLPADWAFGEALAFGSLVIDGTQVRLSGQDSGRGTFSQRHAAMYDIVTGERWVPLGHLKEARAPFEVIDSSLSEYGVLGFEYGYSVVAKSDLVLWEAQFGDFSNGGQIVIDQFLAAAEEKWQQTSRLVLLLPHGYEGQGPEHSSARLERFLQLCAENNLQVANPTTPAQYFHLLRRQASTDYRVFAPLIIMTPKSLLRLPAAASPISEFTQGDFLPVIDAADSLDRASVSRIVLCSGKVYYDLTNPPHPEAAKPLGEGVAVLRLEQYYPFPSDGLRKIMASYPNAQEIVWCQEEPQNMGAWTFVRSRIEKIAEGKSLRYVGRVASASPATGFFAVHEAEQSAIVIEALTLAG